MFCQVFKLDKYFNQTQIYFNFFDGLFLLEEENKQQVFDKLNIPSSSYRTQRLKENTSRYYIATLLEYFKYNDILEENIIEYETLLSKIYYCCYYKQRDKLNEQLLKINNLLEKRNILAPLLTLFKALIIMNLDYPYSRVEEILGEDVKFLRLFYNKKYFKDDLEYLYYVVLYYFDNVDDGSINIIDNLSLQYPRLSWLYYYIKASKAYLKRDDTTALINYEYVLNEFKTTNNLERYFYVLNNVAYIYNILGQYHLSYNLTSSVIEYIFSEVDMNDKLKYKLVKYILMHYLFSNLMLGRYEEIISFIDVVIFDYAHLNTSSAVICLIAANKTNNVKHKEALSESMKYDKDFQRFDKYYKTKNKVDLINDVNFPYLSIIISNLIK